MEQLTRQTRDQHYPKALKSHLGDVNIHRRQQRLNKTSDWGLHIITHEYFIIGTFSDMYNEHYRYKFLKHLKLLTDVSVQSWKLS